MICQHPLTGRETVAEVAEWLRGCAYLRCRETGLQWLDVFPNGVPVYPDISKYSEEFLLNATPELARSHFPPNEVAAWDWIKQNVKPGAKIVELFAESGRFAWHLRQKGYNVFLADPLASHVNTLRKHGFHAEQTDSPRDLPAAWSDADLVIVLESIVRSPQPMAFMSSLHSHFPRARVYLTAPSPNRSLKLQDVTSKSDYPPDFFTRWTPQALEMLLEGAGYSAATRIIQPDMLSANKDWRWKRRAFMHAVILLMRLGGEYEYSLAAWGGPTSPS